MPSEINQTSRLTTEGPGRAPNRAMLRAVGHWVLLTTCDHDGVVSPAEAEALCNLNLFLELHAEA